jgi:ornithine decarboxylase
MNPVRLPGDAREARTRFGVRRFVVDDPGGLEALFQEIEPEGSVIFVRMASSHASAVIDLSSKFGAHPDDVPELLQSVRNSGAEPALAFNVGTVVRSPDAYVGAMRKAAELLAALPFRLRLLDIGGGFPLPYPDYPVPPLEDFFTAIRSAMNELPLTDDGELMAEPGRALSAPGLSAVSRVLLRKSDRLYLNDGMYGAFWELRFKAHQRYACRAFRNGEPLTGEKRSFRLFGPTCDSSDEFPATHMLPAGIGAGDHIEFAAVGAYSLSGRTDFNGFGRYDVVIFENSSAAPQ